MHRALAEGASHAGGVSDQHLMTMDWTATMLAAAGVRADPAYPLDGVDLQPVLADPRHTFARPMYWRMKHRSQRALRDGRWKYLKVDEHEYLFDVEADERERANQAAQPAAAAGRRCAPRGSSGTRPCGRSRTMRSCRWSIPQADMPQR